MTSVGMQMGTYYETRRSLSTRTLWPSRVAQTHQVSLHVLEDQVDVAIVVSLEHAEQRDDILVPGHLLQKHDFAVRALRIGRVLEGVKDLFECHIGPVPLLVHCPPHDAISSLAELGLYLIPSQDVPVNFRLPHRHARGRKPGQPPARLALAAAAVGGGDGERLKN